MIRIVTDSASDLTLTEAEKLQIDLVQLPITFGETTILQETPAEFDTFYGMLAQATELPKTSRPAPEEYLRIFADAEKKQEPVIVICLSSGLSGTYESALVAREMSSHQEQIVVIDSQQAIIAQRMLVDTAVRLRQEGNSAKTIVAVIQQMREKIYVCGAIDTLKFLKMGGRIPKSLAYVGEALKIKPLIELTNKKLEDFGKARGSRGAMKALAKRTETLGIDRDLPVYFAYTVDQDKGKAFQAFMEETFQLQQTRIFPVNGVIGTHVGPKAIAVAFVMAEK